MIDRKMPTKKQIFSFWTNNQEGIKIVKKWKKTLYQNDRGDFEIHEDFHLCCFACGFHKRLERCHIKARCNKGLDDCNNLHLLCRNCHVESEFYEGALYWQWLFLKYENDYQGCFERARIPVEILLITYCPKCPKAREWDSGTLPTNPSERLRTTYSIIKG